MTDAVIFQHFISFACSTTFGGVICSLSLRNGGSFFELLEPENTCICFSENGVAILSRSRDISTSGLAADIFKDRLPVTSDSIRNGAIELLNPENGGLAVETELLYCLEAEI